MSARLGPVNGDASEDLNFAFTLNADRNAVTVLAPNRVTRMYSSVYVPVPVALSDHAPDEWKSNNPTDHNVEFEIYANGSATAEAPLRKLRKFMRKDRRTGEPPDLIFTLNGSDVHTVRIHRMTVAPTLWSATQDEQRVKVTLTLRSLDWEI